ncbi:MAG: ABC transporter substrate-binding protein [Treponema sp.]|nr:ABC transporter substrate-binding protein [Treponema sp.]
MKKIALTLFLCLLIAGTIFAGGGRQRAAQVTDTIVIRSFGDPISFTPNWRADDGSYAIQQNMFHRLTKLDADKGPIGDLAHSWNVTNNGLTITFNLKNNVTWHDGRPVTSADVKYTFDTIKAEPTYFFSPNMSIVDSIDAPNAYTVVFNMNTADVGFIAQIGWYATFILPRHIYDNGMRWEDNPIANNPIGSGPFRFGEYRPGISTTLLAYDNYHEGRPPVDRLIFQIIPDDATAVQAIINGEIDVFEGAPAANLDELRANASLQNRLNKYPSPIRLHFNFEVEAIRDPVLRRAIAMTIDREDIAMKVSQGVQTPEYNMYPSYYPWASNSVNTAPRFDIPGAVRLLEQAGYTRNASGFFVQGLTLTLFNLEPSPDIAMLIQASAAQAGIGIVLEILDIAAWSTKVGIERDFMIQMQGGFMGPDPAAMIPIFGTGGARNYGNYSNPQVDDLLRRGGEVLDQNQRARFYHEAQRIMADELPYIPIIDYAAYDFFDARLVNLPIDGAGQWGWQEYTHTYFR